MRIAPAIVAWVLFISAARAQTTQPDARLPQWLADLGSDQWTVREEAEADLVHYGPDCIPALNQLIAASPDIEVQSRARTVLKRITDWPVYPTFITLLLHQTPARDAFARIAAAANLQLPAEHPDLWTSQTLPTVTLDADRQPFWSVVADACRQTGLTVNLDLADRRTVELVPGHIGTPSAGSAILGLTPVPTNVFLDESGSYLKFPMIAEPGVRVLEYLMRDEQDHQLWSFEEAVDAAGHDLHFDPPYARETDPTGNWTVALVHNLPGTVLRLSRLRVRAPLLIEASAARMEVADFTHLTTATQTDSGVTITVTRTASSKPDSWELDESINPGDVTPDQADLIQRYFKDSARLLDDEGRPFFVGIGGIPAAGLKRHIIFTRHGVASRYPRGQPTRLLIEIPLSVRQISVPLNWTDVALN